MILCKSETNELFIDGVIGADWTGDGVTASHVSSALSILKGRPTVRINSPGGSADEGIAIYNLLKRHPGGVDTHNESIAASAASVIFLAGDKRTMERGSKLMIHCAHCVAIGNSGDMKKMADVLTAYDASLAAIYADTMNIDTDQILALMAEETWYDAEAAVESGLATDMAATLRKKRAAAAAWFKHPPQDLFDQDAETEAKKDVVHKMYNRKVAEMRSKMA